MLSTGHDIGSATVPVENIHSSNVYCDQLGDVVNKVNSVDAVTVSSDTLYADVAYASVLNVSGLATCSSSLSALSINCNTLLATDSLEVTVGADIPSITSSLLTMSGNIVMNSARITNLSSPLNDLDAANKVYVDNATANVGSMQASINDNTADIASLQADVDQNTAACVWTFVPRGRLYLNAANPVNEYVTTWAEDPNFVIGAQSFLMLPPLSSFNVVNDVSLAEWPINMTKAVGTYEIWSGFYVERPVEIQYSGDMTAGYVSVAVQPSTNYTIRLEIWPANPAGKSTDGGLYQTYVQHYVSSASL